MRKVIICFLLLMIIGILPSNANAEDIKIIIDEEEHVFEAAPVITEGRTLVPMRPILEALGAEVAWSPEANTAIGIWEDMELQFPVGNNFVLVENTLMVLDVEIQLREGTTFIPLRFISEFLGYSLDWQQEINTITIYRQDDEPLQYLDIYSTDERVQVNTATYEELKQIEGVSSELASNIINYRVEYGPYPFLTAEDIMEVAGIGEEEFLILKEHITTAYSITGIASWYGDKFHGRRTASGEVYDKNQLTAAHPQLPFGTFVKVTFLQTGESTIVRINDRGPHVGGRIIDLSRMAAETIGLRPHGIGEVEVEILETR